MAKVIHFLTIVLDGMPYIRHHLPEFEKLPPEIFWRWHIVHGASMNEGSTKWCKPQAPRLSLDGTSEYLNSIRAHPNVRLYESSRWMSKDHMVDAPLSSIPDCVLMQIDSDELWHASQLESIVELFESNPQIQRAYFGCEYFVGPDIVTIGENCYGANLNEWLRAWRFVPGMKFFSHEPPFLGANSGMFASRHHTVNSLGLKFRHMAYALEKQVQFKETFYGYKNALSQWNKLQAHPGPWPVKLKTFLPWVDDRVQAVRIPVK